VVGVVDVVDGVVADGSITWVVVLTDGVGTAIVVCVGAALSPSPLNSCVASTTARPNNAMVATTSPTCVRPKRDLRSGLSGGRISGGGYGV
jgi:hypothetical protein